MQLEQQRLYYLEKIYGKSEPENELLTEENDAGARKKESVLGGIERRIEDLLESIKEEERPYFFIDGLECMKPDIWVNKLGFILPNAKAKYIVSCNEIFEIERRSHSRTEIWEEIPDLTDSDAKNVMEGLLNVLSKNLYKEIEEEVLLKNYKKNPFYINMIIQRLNMMGFEDLQQARTEQDIVKHSIEVIREIPDDMEEAALYLLKNAIDSLGGVRQRFYDVVYLIGVSRSGLRESDILTISKKLGNEITQLDLSRFIHYVDFLFAVREDGQIVFSNEFIQDGILKNIERQKYVNAIADYVKSLDMDDNLKRSEGMYYARITQDAKTAEEIFVYLSEHFDKTLGMSVVEEAYADKGVFYCAKMEEMPQAFRFFANIWYNLSFLEVRSKEELEIHGKVCSQFVSCMERRLEKEEKTAYLWYLYKAYCNEKKICEMTSEDEVACMEKALNVISKLWEKEQSIQSECEVANCYNAMAWAYKRNGQLEKACRIREKEIKLWQTIYYKKTREWKHLGSIAHASYELYWLYREAQNEGMAKLYFWFAVNYYEDMYRIKYDTNFLQKISDIYSEAGELLLEEGKVEEAYSYYEKAIQMAQQSCEYEAEEKNKSSCWKKLCLRYQDMGGLLCDQNRTEEALEYFKKSLAAMQKACERFAIKSYKKDMHITYYNIGIILCELDRKEMAKNNVCF